MPSGSLPLTVLQEIDRVCDSFEAAWHAGLKPRIEDYLNVTTLEYRTVLFGELLAREVELRKKAGESPEAVDYVPRFACHGELILRVLNLRMVRLLGRGNFWFSWRTTIRTKPKSPSKSPGPATPSAGGA